MGEDTARMVTEELSSANSLNILVVDDDRTSQLMLESTLKEWGHQVTISSSAVEALSLLQSDPAIQLLITDSEMPEMDGIELCSRARRSLRPHYLSVIVLTAKGSKEHYLAALEAGADAFLSKSFDLTELYLQLQVVVRISTLESSLARQIQDAEHSRGEAEKISRFKSDFLANMSHEIRTPMNGVLGMVGLLLQQGSLNDIQREYADLIRQSAENLLVVLNDILDFSKIEAGRLEVERIPFSPRAIASEALLPFVVRSLDTGVALTGEFAADVPGQIWGDPARFRQVLINLISNSMKFTQTGGVLLSLSMKEGQLLACVQDSGPGIPIEQVREIFQPFTQVDPSIHRLYGGTGLGLAICQRLTELMGGRLELESELGKGTLVRCYLPGDTRKQTPVETLPSPELISIWIENPGYQRLLEQTARHLSSPIQPWDPTQKSWNGVLVVDSRLLDEARLNALLDHKTETARLVLLPTQTLHWNVDPTVTQIARPFTTDSVSAAVLGKESGSSDNLRPTADSDSPLRVLLAEDNPIGQTVVRLMLEQEKCEVTVVGDGQSALEQRAQASYDLALMDVQMPVMNGLEATRQIRRWEAEQRQPALPIVALTALAYESDRRLALESGMDSYLTKPVVVSELRYLLQEIRKSHQGS